MTKELATRFKGARLHKAEQLLDTLVSLGRAREAKEHRYTVVA